MKYTKEECVRMLCEKYAQLDMVRYPKRSDFSAGEVAAIKAFLGPWPRALEISGVKPPQHKEKEQKS